jgi:proteasome-associated ATPase
MSRDSRNGGRDFERDQRKSREPQRDRSDARVFPETQLKASALLDEILNDRAPKDPRLTQYLLLLRHQLEVDERQFQEAVQALAEYEEAYEKLTSPANRIATYLGKPDEGIALVAVGESEYYSNIDPKLENPNFNIGTRVKVNEAFAVIGDLGYHPTGPIVKVGEVLDDGRLRVATDPQGLSGRIIMRSSDLQQTAVKAGDELRLEPNMRVALEHFAQREVRDYYLEDVPKIPWSAIGGQEEAIAVIRDAIELPLLHPELFERFNKRPLKGILLYGPPGCGKTLIGKATAYNLTQEYKKRLGREVQEYFMYINGPKILNMWLGESERMVREIFAQAREKAREGYLVFIFIDEAESLLRVRSSGRWLNISNTLVPQFAAEMDGLVSLQNVVVMLTSNRPDYIDPAVLRPERIDRRVKVGRPDRRASRDILKIYLDEQIPLDPALIAQHGGDVPAAREELVERTLSYMFRRDEETRFLEVYLRNGSTEILHWRDLVSGALIKSTVERAKDFAIKRSIECNSADEGLSVADLERAVRVEYKENEIFPKSDAQEDWLKLLDYEPENVVNVRPIRPERMAAAAASRRSII